MTTSSVPCAPVSTHTTVYLPNILLDETNYPAWLFRMESFLRGQNLFGFVDGTIPCPPQFVTATDGTTSGPSMEYIQWKTTDQSIINMIGQTLSSVATTCAVGSKSAKQLWENLKLKFAAPNRQNILQLKSNLQNLKKGNDDIETYLDKVKVARDALETVGVSVDDEDIVVTVLRGLPAEFAAIKTVIRAQFVSCTLSQLKTLLKAAEVDIENENQCATPLTAMVASNSSNSASSSTLSSGSTQVQTAVSSQSVFSTIPSQMASMVQSPSIQTSVQVPNVPPGFSSQVVTPTGFVPQVIPSMPLSTQQAYTSIPAIPYGFLPMNSYNVTDPTFGMTGMFAGRGPMRPNFTGRFNNANNNFGPRNFNTGQPSNFNMGNGGFNANSNLGFPGFPRNFSGATNSNNNSNIICQLCNKVGHVARTCRTLSNFQGMNQFNGLNVAGCQYCGKPGHKADRCYYIIGFPGQQQQDNEVDVNTPTAMMAATNQAPQFWLADTGATNHMTNNAQLLTNLVQYPSNDTVSIGQGAGQGPIQGSE